MQNRVDLDMHAAGNDPWKDPTFPPVASSTSNGIFLTVLTNVVGYSMKWRFHRRVVVLLLVVSTMSATIIYSIALGERSPSEQC